MKRAHAALVFVFVAACAREPEDAAPAGGSSAPAVELSGPRLTIGEQAQHDLGIVDAPLAAAQHARELVLSGHVRDDPSANFVLRAPIAGVWRMASDATLPNLGARIDANAALGWIEPRLTPAERADVVARAATARADLAALGATAEASARELERARTLNAADKSVSDRALDDARARAAGDAARVEGARTVLAALESLTADSATPRAELTLHAPRGGHVLAFEAHPGEVVDAGAPLVRISDLSRPLIELEFPPGAPAARVEHVRVGSAFDDEHDVSASFVVDAPSIERGSSARTRLFRVDVDAETSVGMALVPGAAVRARAAFGDERPGFVVPRTAVVRLAGRAWVWKRAADEEFERVELTLDLAHGDGWFTDAAWAADARVVVAGAQALLSAELLAAQGRAEPGD